MKIYNPSFTTSLWQLGFITDEEFKKYMKSENYYKPKVDVPSSKKSNKSNTLYALTPIKFSNDVQDFIKTHARVEDHGHFKLYFINDTSYIEFYG